MTFGKINNELKIHNVITASIVDKELAKYYYC